MLIAPPEIKPEYEVDWALRKQTHLGPVLCEGPQDKISVSCYWTFPVLAASHFTQQQVREVEGLNEVGEM